MVRRAFALLILTAWCASLGSCRDVAAGEAVTLVEVLPAQLSLLVGRDSAITARARLASGAFVDGSHIFWSAENPEIASVDAAGRISGITPGKARVAASAGGRSAVVQVSVAPLAVAAVLVSPTSAGMAVGGTQPLSAAVVLVSGDTAIGRRITWRSSQPSVATVDSVGRVLAIAAGGASISATVDGIVGTATVSVTAVPVAFIVVSPASATLLVGGSLDMNVVTLAADSSQLSGRNVSWTTSDPSIASVSANGVVTALAPGATILTATSEGRRGSALLTVVRVPVRLVTVLPATASLMVGGSIRLVATAFDSVGGVLGGRTIVWRSLTQSLATVDDAGLVTATAAGTARITATVDGVVGTAVATVAVVPVAFTVVSPSSQTLTVGGSLQLSAVTLAADSSQLTGRSVSWTSSAPAVASVSANGVVTALAPGAATITATSEGQRGTAQLTVVRVPVHSVTVSPATASLVIGGSIRFAATALDSTGRVLGGRTVVWRSLTPSLATVDASGLVTATAAGTALITATVDGVAGTAVATVAVVPVAFTVVSPASATLLVGGSLSMSARTLAADSSQLGGRSVSWTSSVQTVASVSANGVVTALAPGATIITATSEGQQGTALLTVVRVPVHSVAVSPSTTSLTVGDSIRLVATALDSVGGVVGGRTIVWRSLTQSLATVDATGLVTAIAAGSARITATVDGVVGTADVTVTVAPVAFTVVSPSSATLSVGGSLAMNARTLAADSSQLTGRSVTWTSSVPTVASVSATGVVTALAPGATTITATSEGQRGTAQLTVVRVPVHSVTVSPATASLVIGGSIRFAATALDSTGRVLGGRTVVWRSLTPSLATVDAAGLVTAIAAGSARITATVDGVVGTATVDVTVDPVAFVVVSPPSATLSVGGSLAMNARTLAADSSQLTGRSVTWTSSVPTVASVSATGVVTGLAPGATTITATSEGQKGTARITVVRVPVHSVTLLPATASLMTGRTIKLTATALDSVGGVLSGRTIVFTSLTPSLATVDATGLVTAIAAGTARITATSEGKTGTSTISITNPAVALVTVSPNSVSLNRNETTQLTVEMFDATGMLLQGRKVTWQSQSSKIAQVDSNGLVTAIAKGTVLIVATSEGVSGSATVTVK